MGGVAGNRDEDNNFSNKNKKRKKDVFIYGNYRHYYGYRIDRSVVEDPRLSVLKQEWFQGKDCLDIGCNQGLVTISIAKKFLCRSIMGIDIDGGLIETAKWNLKKIAKAYLNNSRSTKSSSSEVTEDAHRFDDSICQFSKEGLKSETDAGSPLDKTVLEKVFFQKENFVESLHNCMEEYDTILCLSVTKWIHLNWGDDGIITLFAKIWRLLRPGGVFILEPQPWSSYKRKRQVSETARMNFNNILLHPELFGEILLDKVGFRYVETVSQSLSGSATGFDRPIFVFSK